MKASTKKGLTWAFVVLAIGAGVFAYLRYAAAHRAPEVTYKTAAAERRTIAGRVTASGTLSAIVTVQVGTQVSGRIQELFANFNSKVTKGQVVAKIDPQLFQASAAQAAANYASAKANVTKAEAVAAQADRDYARARSLREEGLASQADVDTAMGNAAAAHASIDVARAGLQQSKASLDQAHVNLSYTTIVSPIDGVVISRNVDVGQTVAASLQAPTIFTIAQDLTKMQVDTNVAEGDVGRLQVGMDTYFTVDAFPGQRFRGKVREIRNAAQTLQNVVTYDAVIEVDNSDLKLRPGMTANVTVTYAERNAVIAVPNAALRFRPPNAPAASASARARAGAAPAGSGGNRPAGARKRDEGEAETKPVWKLSGITPESVGIQTGLSDGSWTEVVGGPVAEGDLIVVDSVSASAPAATAPAGAAPGGGMRRMF